MPHMVEVEIEIDGRQGSVPVSLPYATVVDQDGQKSLSALRDKMMELGVHPSGDEQVRRAGERSRRAEQGRSGIILLTPSALL